MEAAGLDLGQNMESSILHGLFPAQGVVYRLKHTGILPLGQPMYHHLKYV